MCAWPGLALLSTVDTNANATRTARACTPQLGRMFVLRNARCDTRRRAWKLHSVAEQSLHFSDCSSSDLTFPSLAPRGAITVSAGQPSPSLAHERGKGFSSSVWPGHKAFRRCPPGLACSLCLPLSTEGRRRYGHRSAERRSVCLGFRVRLHLGEETGPLAELSEFHWGH